MPDHSTALSPDAFLPALEEFASAGSLALRDLAARAILPAITASSRRDTALALAHRVCEGCSQARTNSMHGWLLQLESLLPHALDGASDNSDFVRSMTEVTR